MLPRTSDILPVNEEVLSRADELSGLGVHAADAVHVAAAEAQKADALLTCDDQLIRVWRRHQGKLRVRVCDPITWMKEHEDEANA